MPRSNLINVPFAGGISESIDPLQAPPGALRVIENARQDRIGRIVKRRGFTALPVLSEAAKAVAALRDELVAVGSSVSTYSPVGATWRVVDDAPEAVPTRDVVWSPIGKWVAQDVALCGGYEVIVWRSGDAVAAGDLFLLVRDATTGAVVIPGLAVTTTTAVRAPRCITVGTKVVIAWFEGSALKWCTWDSAAPTTVPTVLTPGIALYVPIPNFDICTLSSSTFALLYTGAAGTMTMSIYPVTLGAATTTRALTEQVANVIATSVCVSGGYLWAAYLADNQRVRAIPMDAGSLVSTLGVFIGIKATTSNVVVCLSVCATTGGSVVVTWLNPSNELAAVSVSPAGSGFNIAIGTEAYFPFSRGFYYDGSVYMVARSTSKTTLLIKADANAFGGWKPVCIVAPRTSTNNQTPGLEIDTPGAHILANGTQLVALGSTISDASNIGNVGIARIGIDFANAWVMAGAKRPVSIHNAVPYGQNLIVSGGIPATFDGARLSELSFIDPPEVTYVTSTVGGGLDNATWSYAAYWEQIDAHGTVHRSPLSDIITIPFAGGAGGTNKVTFTIQKTYRTRRQDATAPQPRPYLVLCRTKANGTTSLLYRLTNIQVPTTAENSIDQAGTTLSYVDDNPGDTNTFVYTVGGVLDSQIPSALHWITSHAGRIVGIGDDRRTLWFSSEIVGATDAPTFNDQLTMSCEQEITGLASLDDKLIVFSEQRVWVLYGHGPNATGAGSDWTQLTAIPAPGGCVDPRSVVSTPIGVFFQSREGMQILGRDLQLAPIGRDVQATLAAYPCIASATHVQGQSAVYWECQDVTGTAGIGLVYEYVQPTWSVDKRWDGTTIQPASAGGALWAGSYVYLSGAGVLAESAGTSLDVGEWVTMAIETHWMSAQGPLAFQRARSIQLLTDAVTNHGIKLSLGFDFKATFAQSYTWSDAALSDGQSRVAMRVGSQNGANPRCRAIKLRVEDVQPAAAISTGAGAAWSGFAVEVLPLTGTSRLGAGKRV